MGMAPVFSSAAGPDELQYVPADAAVVGYANVRQVMNSQFRQRFRQFEPNSRDKDEFQAMTGVNIEQDIDSVVAAFMPGPGGANRAEESAIILARGRFDANKLESLAKQHGGKVDTYQGKKLVSHDGPREDLAIGFVENNLVAMGSATSVRKAIDAGRQNRNVVANNDLMRLVAEMGNSNAWAVGRFDAIANDARMPNEVRSQISNIAFFSASTHVNGGISGVVKAETLDEASAQNLRDVVRGFLALAKMQAGTRPGMKEMADSLQLSGEGKNVALAFTIPSEFFDALEAMGRKKIEP
jgi:hypothetical protein